MARITQQQAWERYYAKNRYMQNLTIDELSERHSLVADNWMRLVVTDGNLGVGPVSHDDEPMWIELYTHCLHELRLRGIQFPGPFTAMDQGFVGKVDFDKKRAVFQRPEVKRGLFKLGKKAHLFELREKGHFRLTPASFYGKGGYGYAVDDDEINKYIELNHGNSVISSLLDGINLHEIARYNIKLPIRAPTDYYLFCMSNTFRYRHVFDFNYDACLQIKDRNEFLRRVRAGVRAHFGKAMELNEIDVNYVDPLRPENRNYVAMTMKHIKFAYQTEFRLCAVPRVRATDLGVPLTISIGPIDDISEIIDFDEIL